METTNAGVDHTWLKGLETPYLWRPSEFLDTEARVHLVWYLRDYNHVSTFTSFIMKLILGYELYATSTDAAAALTTLGELEQQLFWQDIVSNCSFYRGTRRAQWHTVLASRAVLLAHLGRLTDSRKVVEDGFDTVSTFNTVEKSAIFGIKSGGYLEYGPKAWSDALEFAKEAIHLNPNEAEWYFLVGKILGKIRKESGQTLEVPQEEVYFLEKAVALGRRANHVVHLANVYTSLASQFHVENTSKDEAGLVNKFTRLSIELLHETLKAPENDAETRLGCLEGLLRHSSKLLAKKELRTVMEELLKEPKKIKSFFSVAGKYYLKVERNSEKAMRYFEEGSELGDYACSVSLLRLHLMLGRESDPEPALRRLVARYSNHTGHRESAQCQLGAWLLLGRRDVAAALEVFNKVLEGNPAGRSALMQNPLFLRGNRPIDLLLVMHNQVMLAPAGVLLPEAKDKFLRILASRHPDVMSKPVDPQLLENLGISKSSQDARETIVSQLLKGNIPGL